MTEVLFYQLRDQPLEDVLPELLGRCLARGWRAIVQTGTNERAESLDASLWTSSDDSFLPHGLATAEFAEDQPILLTSKANNPNHADVRFLVDGAKIGAVEGFRRVALLFDGTDEESLSAARQAWQQVRADGHTSAYWQQDQAGRWQEKSF